MAALRLLLAPLMAFALSGCFVLDELDWGSAELDKYSVNPEGGSGRAAKPESQPEPAAAPARESSWEEKRAEMSKWWNEARTLSSGEKDEGIVRCRLGGRDQFMRIEDCQARGGQVGS